MIEKYNEYFYFCSRRLRNDKQQNDVVEELLLSVDTLATRLFVLTNPSPIRTFVCHSSVTPLSVTATILIVFILPGSHSKFPQRRPRRERQRVGDLVQLG